MNEWISVKDRLPNKSGHYLAYIKNRNAIYVEKWENNLWFLYDWWGITDDITHWMPFPEPPKEEEE